MIKNPFKLLDEEEEDHEKAAEAEAKVPKSSTTQKVLVIFCVLFLFALAIIPRLYFLFFVSDPQNAGLGWYGDVYHHWQIAYLSKEIGFTHGITRLWDLKGLEYFWGIGYSYILVILFALFGSADIIIPRLLDVVLGSFSIVLIFLIVRKYFNFLTAAVASVFAALNPISVFNDTSGMHEPVGIFFLLLGILFFENGAFLSGLFLAVASTMRAEYWLFSIVLVLAVLLREKVLEKKIVFFVGWAIPILVYMKILLDRTGNPIYPLWWNFLGNAVGKWQADVPFSPQQLTLRYFLGFVLAFTVLCGLVTIIKKPKWYLFGLLGFTNIAFLAFFVGFTDYLKSFLPRFFVDRIMVLPYVFCGFLITIFLVWFIPKKTHQAFAIVGSLIVAAILVISQYEWVPIWKYFSPSSGIWKSESKIAGLVAASYTGGSVLIPEDRPWLTYMLYKDGIEGKKIRGQLYDPFYYMGKEPYLNWGEKRLKIFQWLRDEDIKLIVVYPHRERYTELFKREEKNFELTASMPDSILIYRVKDL